MDGSECLRIRPKHAAAATDYPWLTSQADYAPLAERIAPPEGFARVALDAGSYADWLRHLPMEPPGTPVRSYRGDIVQSGDAPHVAGVVALDVGTQDLQQCADTILRLRSEYLWHRGVTHPSARAALAFRFTSGDVSTWLKWARGYRPVIRGPRATFKKRARPDASRSAFRAYLSNLFRFAGTLSLAREGRRVAVPSRVRAGDFISLGGSPGHAIMVLDVVKNAAGETRVLLGQSYMPAQSFHVLRDDDSRAAWFVVASGGAARIATWDAPFPWSKLRRF